MVGSHDRTICPRDPNTVTKIPTDKAAGYDGVDINLIKMLTEQEDSPLTNILTHLFKVAFTQGATLPSWRKSVITMIPNKKKIDHGQTR